MLKRLLHGLLVLLILLVLIFLPLYYGWYGDLPQDGDITPQRRADSAPTLLVPGEKQILFGDLHVHTTFSVDAFRWNLPFVQGEGVHPVSDACDFARFCSKLDFFAITDHAESLSPHLWQQTKNSIRQCNAVGGADGQQDLVAFLGWEWSHFGLTPDEHWGHKNVILRDLDDDKVPARPIAADGMVRGTLATLPPGPRLLAPLYDPANFSLYQSLTRHAAAMDDVPVCPQGTPVRELPLTCLETAADPKTLFEKLRDWNLATLVIPHGTSWGINTAPGATWDKQLAAGQDEPEMQRLMEVYSGHGNTEEYRDWRAVIYHDDGSISCPPPRSDYEPACFRAGEVIRARCLADGEPDAECDARATDARQNYAEAGHAGVYTVPGMTAEDYLDSGQCRDCFLPAFRHRPGTSVQYALAVRNFDDPEHPRGHHFGLIASSDNHSARPGTGYKEFGRGSMSDRRGPVSKDWRDRIVVQTDKDSRSYPFSWTLYSPKAVVWGQMDTIMERQTSFFLTGGLAAVHSEGRSRQQIWDALMRREVYGTSGDRILLWFNMVDGNGAVIAPMGGAVQGQDTPHFRVKALGAFEQKPGCPPDSRAALGEERLERICRGECYQPGDARKPITRIEVIRIRPQITKGEDIGQLIEDVWQSFPCDDTGAGCEITFKDPDYAATGRDTLYYVRAIEAPSLAVNGGLQRCTRDESGNCVTFNPCWGDYRTAPDDDCLASVEERAWSSPIYLHYGASVADSAGTASAGANSSKAD